VFKHEKFHGGKISKERLSVLECTNAIDSTKLKLLVIGKSKATRSNTNVRTFPYDYVSQNRACMHWIKQLDLSFKKQKINILLFIDTLLIFRLKIYKCNNSHCNIQLFLSQFVFPYNTISRLIRFFKLVTRRAS